MAAYLRLPRHCDRLYNEILADEMVRETGIHLLSLSLLSSCFMDSGCSGWSVSSHIRPSSNVLKMAEKQG